jgi:sodium-dependent dicarboxylate transporter 2/3/5
MEERGRQRGRIATIGWLAAPVLAVVAALALPPDYVDAGGERVPLGPAARATAAVAVWMAVWWLTEAIPIYATALLPLALFPVSGATTMKAAATPYAHPLIFLFLGGFLIALGMQRWGLDRRVALSMLRLVGARPAFVVGGFMAVTAGASMWVSNTATSVMMLPIALGVIDLAEPTGPGAASARGSASQQRSFAVCLLLGIAYGASIGGVGTLVGTPPNLFLASFAESQLGREISFARWMGVGIPLVAIFLPLTWWLLTRVLHPLGDAPLPGVGERVAAEHAALGPLSRGERLVLGIFLLTAAGWLLRPILVGLEIGGAQPFAGLTDTGVAMLGALLLFVLPVDLRTRTFGLDWQATGQLPWGILLLFGGGLSLASAIDGAGLGAFLGSLVGGLAGISSVLITAAVVTLVIFLTELTSNTATAATLLPILAGLAPGLGIDPFALVVPAAVAASCAFMLPVATPPNAVVFGAGYIAVAEMARVGIWLNLVGVALITALTYAAVIPLLGG